jgi:hypothetical protein
MIAKVEEKKPDNQTFYMLKITPSSLKKLNATFTSFSYAKCIALCKMFDDKITLDKKFL